MSSRDPFASSGRVSRVARVAPLSKDPANAYHRSSWQAARGPASVDV